MAEPRDVKLNQHFALWLRQAMQAAGFVSQRSLAIESNISTASVSRMLKGVQLPDQKNIRNLAKALKKPISEVVRMAGYKELVLTKWNKKPQTKRGSYRSCHYYTIPLRSTQNWFTTIENERRILVPREIKADFALCLTDDKLSFLGYHTNDYLYFSFLKTTFLPQDLLLIYEKQAGTIFLGRMHPQKTDLFQPYGDKKYPPFTLSNQYQIGGILSGFLAVNMRSLFLTLPDNPISPHQQWQKMIDQAISAGLSVEFIQRILRTHLHMKGNPSSPGNFK